MTRPTVAAERFVGKLDPRALEGVTILYAPLLNIVGTGAKPDLSEHKGVIFTSANGVRFAPKGQGRPAFCVGQGTAKRARAAQWDVQVIEEDADALVGKLTDLGPQSPLAHLAGAYQRGDITERLAQAGIKVDVHVLYDQPTVDLTPQAITALAGEVPVILPLFSARSAAHLARQVKCAPRTHVVAISRAVADAAKGVSVAKLQVVARSTGADMVSGIEKLLLSDRLS